MAKQITKTVYTFEEMQERAKLGKSQAAAFERVKHNLREGATDGEWWDGVYDIWKEALAQIGFENADISFSGFGSQGDGASFKAKVDDAKLIEFLSAEIEPNNAVLTMPGSTQEDFRPWILSKLGKKHWKADQQFLPILKMVQSDNIYLSSAVNRSDSRYSHENTCRFESDCERLDDDRHKLLSKRLAGYIQAGESLRYSLSRAIYADLDRDYCAVTADEALKEFADGNDYTFNEYGSIEG